MGYDILAVAVMSAIVILPGLAWKAATRSNTDRPSYLPTIVLMVIWVIIASFLVIALNSVCVCAFNDRYGSTIQKDF